MFSYICWAAPTNVPVNQMFGVRTRMGMGKHVGVLTFDISWISSLIGEFHASLLFV